MAQRLVNSARLSVWGADPPMGGQHDGFFWLLLPAYPPHQPMTNDAQQTCLPAGR
ncbi:hypothetical protein [uncultured Mucilaginibacter sp.]|uniref:hypothetical protein n=1 Tax=uncultured Mucilaginibacter sp. TaxID=797541 RepID=UPI0025E85989|nr:hypothetical protein [uncultured Mucilaginibacter sp.]